MAPLADCFHGSRRFIYNYGFLLSDPRVAAQLVDTMIDTDNGDIVFVCEHWLTQHEIACFKQRSSDHDRWTYMKSSVDAEQLLTGRPHGGIGFIANRVRGIRYKPLM